MPPYTSVISVPGAVHVHVPEPAGRQVRLPGPHIPLHHTGLEELPERHLRRQGSQRVYLFPKELDQIRFK